MRLTLQCKVSNTIGPTYHLLPLKKIIFDSPCSFRFHTNFQGVSIGDHHHFLIYLHPFPLSSSKKVWNFNHTEARRDLRLLDVKSGDWVEIGKQQFLTSSFFKLLVYKSDFFREATFNWKLKEENTGPSSESCFFQTSGKVAVKNRNRLFSSNLLKCPTKKACAISPGAVSYRTKFEASPRLLTVQYVVAASF